MTPRRVVISLRADEDIEHAFEHYLHTAGTDVALGFVAALEGARTHLSAHPGIGSARFAVVTGIGELRDFPLDRYPYVFLYTDDLDAVRIHRVLHTSRDIPAALAEHR